MTSYQIMNGEERKKVVREKLSQLEREHFQLVLDRDVAAACRESPAWAGRLIDIESRLAEITKSIDALLPYFNV